MSCFMALPTSYLLEFGSSLATYLLSKELHHLQVLKRDGLRL